MQPHPLPIRSIARIIGGVAVVTLLAQIFGIRQLHGISLIVGFVAIASLLVYHAWVDNARTTYRDLQPRRTCLIGFVFWLPFLFLLLPGVVILLFIDDKADHLVRVAEAAVVNKVVTVEASVEETIRESEAVPRHWYWPPDWFREGTRIVERKVLRTVQQDILQPAPRLIRLLFAIVNAVLRIGQLMLYVSLTFILIRSYVYFVARAALFNRSEIEFSLP